MIGKLLKIVVCVLSIGVLQYCTVLGCQTSSDCPTQTTTGSMIPVQCCHEVDPPRCMDGLKCWHYLTDKLQQNPTFYPKFTVPDYNRLTPPKDRFTVPDYIDYTLPDFNELTERPEPNIHVDVPTYNYNNNDDYDGYTDNSSGSFSPGALIGAMVAIIILTIIVYLLRCWVRYRPTRHILQPSAATTSQTNLVAPQNREPRRIVIIAVTRDEDQINRCQNLPPEGEPPFLSEEDMRHNLHNNCAQDPPPYDEGTAGAHLPKYEDLVNENMDLPPPPAYPEVQATSQSSMNPSQNTLPTQQNVIEIEPPSYDEAQAATNEAIEPLP